MANDNENISLTAVSYTHLDVYKRQILYMILNRAVYN